LNLVMPDAQLACVAQQLSHLFGDRRMRNEPAKYLAGFPDVDDLPDDRIGLAHVVQQDRLLRAGALAIADHTLDLIAQLFDLIIVEHAIAFEEAVGLKLLDLVRCEHGGIIGKQCELENRAFSPSPCTREEGVKHLLPMRYSLGVLSFLFVSLTFAQ